MKTTMTKELFFKQVRNNVEIIMKDCSIELNEVIKPGNLKLTGIVIRAEGQNIIPTIYLNEYFEMYISNEITMDEIVERVISDYKEHSTKDKFDIFSKLEDTSNIYLRVLNRNLSCEYLKDTFFKEIEDTNLVLVPYIKFDDFREGSATTKITNSLLDFLKMVQDELFELAFQNCKKNMKPLVNDMEDILYNEIMGSGKAENKIPDMPTMTVVTNEEKLNGATVIFYSDILKQIAEKWDCDLIIIPSSIHELIILADNDTFQSEDVRQMIVETNEREVSQDEILDNIPYVYRRSADRIEKF